MYEGSNKTALASQRQIADACMQLLEEKEFCKLSVCEVCRTASVSRQTFYSLFSSLEDVMTFEFQTKYQMNPEDHLDGAPNAGLACLCRIYGSYIAVNLDFIRLLVNNHILDCMYQSLYHGLADCSCFAPQLKGEDRSMTAAFMASGFTGIARYFAQRPEEVCSEQVEKMAYRLFSGVYLEELFD